MNILMAAAENDALPGGKVGGIGDVVRDIAPALAGLGHTVKVVNPGYQKFSTLPGAEYVSRIECDFRGKTEQVDVFRVPAKTSHKNVEIWILEHPLFGIGGAGKIYCDDPDNRPFARDASKFALFSVAVSAAICEGLFDEIDALHLHDWHTALIAVLRAYEPTYKKLKSILTVYSIHNLSLQGTRPFSNDDSSLDAWFPHLKYASDKISDPRATNCINPMRAGITLCDRVHTVSPTYVQEILEPSDPQAGKIGGEGLEQDLRKRLKEGRLIGILNGCEYPRGGRKSKPGLETILNQCSDELLKLISKNSHVESAHFIAQRRLDQLRHKYKTAIKQKNKPHPEKVLITSVGRITDQKIRILKQPMEDGRSAIEHLLDNLNDDDLFIILGSGDSGLEQFLTRVAGHYANFLFIKGYSETLSDQLYKAGDLFLMPSSFEPCGISQMLAMREGQPCLVHAVGGLRDTIKHNENGFSFEGKNPDDQARQLLSCLQNALHIKANEPEHWQEISRKAKASRFTWKEAAKKYQRLLYSRKSV